MKNKFLHSLLLVGLSSLATVASATIDYTTVAENVNGVVPAAFAGANTANFTTSGFQSFNAPNTGSNVHNARILVARGVAYNLEIGGNFVDMCDRIEIYNNAGSTIPRTTIPKSSGRIQTRSGKIWFNLGDVPLTEGTAFIIKIRYAVEVSGPDVITCNVCNKGTITGAKWVTPNPSIQLPIYAQNAAGGLTEKLNQGTNYALELTVSGLPTNDALISNTLVFENNLGHFAATYTKTGAAVNGVAKYVGTFLASNVTATENNIESNYTNSIKQKLMEGSIASLNLDAASTKLFYKAPILLSALSNQTTHTTDLQHLIFSSGPPPAPAQNPTGTNLVPTHGGVTCQPVRTPSGSIDAFVYKGQRFLQVITSTCAGDPISRSTLVTTDATQGEERHIVLAADNIPWGVQDNGSSPSSVYPAFSLRLSSSGIALDTKSLTSLGATHQVLFNYLRPSIEIFLFPLVQGSHCYLKDTNNGQMPPNTNFEICVDTTNTVQESNETDNCSSF